MKQTIAAIIIILFMASCASKLYEPTQQDVDWVNSSYQYNGSVAEFNHARKMYTQYCQSCHYLHMPNAYTISEWNTIFPNMSVKISIPDSNKQQIYYYIVAGAKDAGGNN